MFPKDKDSKDKDSHDQRSHSRNRHRVMSSKRLDALARAASVEAIRLDEEEAPGRAIERKKKQEDEDHARQEQARTVNKATFRP